MSNNLSFSGRLGGDAELKEVAESQVLEFSVASDVGYGDKKTTNWFRCAIWGKRAEALEQYLKKGQQVFVTGSLTLREFTDKNDNERISPDVRVNELDLMGGKKEDDKEDQPF